jgi:hypothetical protein
MGESRTSGESRSTYGPLVSALGAIVLAVSVFLPWYGISFTAHGVAVAQQVNDQVSAEFGNAALQSYMGTIHAGLTSLVGHEVAALSAHQALSNLNVVLLVIAGLGILIALLALAGPAAASSDANRGPLVLLGCVAGACIVFRIVDPPSPAGELVALSVREGAWLALLGAIAMCAGALWPRFSARSNAAQADPGAVWSELSGWTPET